MLQIGPNFHFFGSKSSIFARKTPQKPLKMPISHLTAPFSAGHRDQIPQKMSMRNRIAPNQHRHGGDSVCFLWRFLRGFLGKFWILERKNGFAGSDFDYLWPKNEGNRVNLAVFMVKDKIFIAKSYPNPYFSEQKGYPNPNLSY
jgi:hypothetical protein